MTKYTELWDEIKYWIKTINGGEAGYYDKSFMKIRFESDTNLLLNKTLKPNMLTVVVRSVFEDITHKCFQTNACMSYEIVAIQ